MVSEMIKTRRIVVFQTKRIRKEKCKKSKSFKRNYTHVLRKTMHTIHKITKQYLDMHCNIYFVVKRSITRCSLTSLTENNNDFVYFFLFFFVSSFLTKKGILFKTTTWV